MTASFDVRSAWIHTKQVRFSSQAIKNQFLFGRNNGIRKTIHAAKKMTLPMKVKVSWFLKLDKIKKMAQKMKSIQPSS